MTTRRSYRQIKREALPRVLRVAHWAIIGNYMVNIGYGSYEIFFVLRPEGVRPGMPLGSSAQDVDPDMMAQRRGYAAEVWSSWVGLTTYVALTEVGPRILRSILTESRGDD
jgi:hypothetical protein